MSSAEIATSIHLPGCWGCSRGIWSCGDHGGGGSTTSSQEGCIDFFLGEVFGLKKGDALFKGRSSDLGVLEDCAEGKVRIVIETG